IDNTLFIPADIGLKYNFISQKIEAVTGITFENKIGQVCIKNYIDPEQVGFVELKKDFSIHYFERTDHFTIEDLIQALLY
ncbi:MAG TPA: hypothetical protein VHP38_07475, partial [Ruminiclostridium sp.]|nr:hypothetical protein [Ruminiclostridium sp.]